MELDCHEHGDHGHMVHAKGLARLTQPLGCELRPLFPVLSQARP